MSFCRKISQVIITLKASYEDFLRQGGTTTSHTPTQEIVADTFWSIWESSSTMLIMHMRSRCPERLFPINLAIYWYIGILICKALPSAQTQINWILIFARNSAKYFIHIMTSSDNSTESSYSYCVSEENEI